MTDRIYALVAELAYVRDEEVAHEVRSPEAVALLTSTVESPLRT